jgi:hypothetical protein
MNTKIILALVATAVVAAALVGVTAAQFANQTPLAATTANQQVQPPCLTGQNNTTQPYCINASTGEPYCYANCTYVGQGNCLEADNGCYQNSNCNSLGYGCGQQEQNQNQYRHGGCGRFW